MTKTELFMAMKMMDLISFQENRSIIVNKFCNSNKKPIFAVLFKKGHG
jgi:hypothetical protein